MTLRRTFRNLISHRGVLLLCLLLSTTVQAARFWGQVQGPGEAPVAWPVVRVLGQAAVIGDSRGYFAIADVQPGVLELLIEARGYLPYRERFRYQKEGAAEFQLRPWTHGDGSGTPADLLLEPDGSGSGTLPGQTARLQFIDRDGDGRWEALAGHGGREPSLLLDGTPLLGPGKSVLRGMDRHLSAVAQQGQYQPASLPGGLFRSTPDGGLWLTSTPLQAHRLTEGEFEETPWRPEGGSVSLTSGSAGQRELDAQLDLRLLPQDPMRLAALMDQRLAHGANGTSGTYQTRGLRLEHQRALGLGLLGTSWQLDHWINHAPVADSREEWLLDTGAARESGKRFRAATRWLAPLTDDLSLRLDLQAETQGLVLDRAELDRLYQRGITTTDYQASSWFDTQRKQDERRLAMALGTDWKHLRGMFRLSVWVEQQNRQSTGSSGPISGLSTDSTAWDHWFETHESTLSSGLRLKDRYALWGALRMDMDVAARYQYYRFERLATEASAGSGALAFDDNLLVLEPRLALVLEGSTRIWHLGWSRYNPMLEPMEYWDLQRAPGSAYSEPLFIEDSDGIAVPRLRTSRSEQVDLGLELRQGPHRGGIQLLLERLEAPVGAWYKADGQNLSEPQLSNAGDLETLDAGFWVETRPARATRLLASLQLGVGRWRHSQLVLPLEVGSGDPEQMPSAAPVGTLYYGPAGRYRLRDLDSRPAGLFPSFGLVCGLGQHVTLPAAAQLDARLNWEYRTPAEGDASGQPGLRLAGTRQLTASLAFSGDKWPGWQLAISGNNLLDRKFQGEGWVVRYRDGSPARLEQVEAAPRSLEVKLVRSW